MHRQGLKAGAVVALAAAILVLTQDVRMRMMGPIADPGSSHTDELVYGHQIFVPDLGRLGWLFTVLGTVWLEDSKEHVAGAAVVVRRFVSRRQKTGAAKGVLVGTDRLVMIAPAAAIADADFLAAGDTGEESRWHQKVPFVL